MDMGRYLFRQVRGSDAAAIYELAVANEYHSDNLPLNRSLIKAYVQRSVKDFAIISSSGVCKNPLYMFVLEDTYTRTVVGVSQIKNILWRLLYQLRLDPFLGENIGKLALKKEDGTWELGGLLLSKEVRGGKLGKLLSYGRLAYLMSKGLAPRMLISGFLKNTFWEYIAIRIGVSKEYNPDKHWRSFKTLTKFMGLLPAHILLAETGIAFGYFEDLFKIPIPIKPESEPARKLLVDMGLCFLKEIEANGILWHGAPWKVIRDDNFMRYKVPQDTIEVDTCKTSCHLDIGMAVLPSDDFRAQYIPVAKLEDGRVYISKKDFSCGKPKHLFIFETKNV
ncbi:MAG: hypothetical protein G01um101429_921 [Parcubacteria group bacterium Gr01-1014_29]|nr:MAG: hypothetical protein G01um101429_921 [Parcubacteria group bacterium Gr01-1014_29]